MTEPQTTTIEERNPGFFGKKFKTERMAPKRAKKERYTNGKLWNPKRAKRGRA